MRKGQFYFVLTLSPRLYSFLNKRIFDRRLNYIIIIIIFYLPSDFRLALTPNVSEHFNNTTAQWAKIWTITAIYLNCSSPETKPLYTHSILGLKKANFIICIYLLVGISKGRNLLETNTSSHRRSINTCCVELADDVIQSSFTVISFFFCLVRF